MKALAADRTRALARSLENRSLQRRRKEQVAAVCYRIAEEGLQFLLVQTRGGSRWTFPKGSLEAGMTRAQTAALEAFEEAGVHGRVEEAPFVHYMRHRGEPDEIFVQVYLCEVLWLGRPQEGKRNPTWYSAEKAKRRLQENRSEDDASGFTHVIDCAVARIRRIRSAVAAPPDELQRVQFEAPEIPGTHTRVEQAMFARYVRAGEDANEMEVALGARLSRVLQFGVPKPASTKLLGTGRKAR